MYSKRNLLFIFFLIVFFLILISAFVINSVLNTNIEDSEAAKSASFPGYDQFEWVFDNMSNGQKITRLTSAIPTSSSLDVSFVVNEEDYGTASTPISSVMVVDPYVTKESDLQVNMGKSLILADTSGQVNDTYRGGKYVFNVVSGNISKVDFDLVDVGDELDGVRINNQYAEFHLVDGQVFRLNNLNTPDRSNFPDKHIINVRSPFFTSNISKIVVHISGSGSLDNFKIHTPAKTTNPSITPTLTVRPTSTIIPSPTPTSSLQGCVSTNTVQLFNKDLLVAKANDSRSPISNPDTKGGLPAGVKLANSTKYTIDMKDTTLFTDDEENIRYKYPVNILPQWGWRGKNNQLTETTEQKNESHSLTAVKRVGSTTSNLFSMECLDWGNARGKTDGKLRLQSVEIANPINSSRFFQNCVVSLSQNNTPRVTKGYEANIKEGEIVEITATHKTTEAEFNECLKQNNNRAPQCQGSHYSMVEVTYCVEEGEVE